MCSVVVNMDISPPPYNDSVGGTKFEIIKEISKNTPKHDYTSLYLV